jgi:hypothetical protein
LHVPHVSLLQQPSSSVPQFFPAEAQVLGAQAVQTLEVQISLVLQVPQLSLPPQPLSRLPQFLPARAQVNGVHDTHLLLLQILPVSQVPQSWVIPTTQLSDNLPQAASARTHAKGVVAGVVGHVQVRTPPHPSESVPHWPARKSLHLSFWQTPHLKVRASQTWPEGQLPQSWVKPQPSGSFPQRPVHATGAHAVQWLFMQRVPMLQILPQTKLLPQVSEMKPQASVLLQRPL